MTKKLTFTGHSDDLFCVSINDQPHEEIDCFSQKAIYILEAESGTILVIGKYSYDGTWLIGIMQVGEECPIPDWKMEIKANPDCSYSPLLIIECPDDIKVDDFNNSDDN